MLVTSEEGHERRSLFLCFDFLSSLLCFHLETITVLLVKEPVVLLAHLNNEHALFLLLEVEKVGVGKGIFIDLMESKIPDHKS